MANMQFTNNAATILQSGISSSATTMTVATGTGALFPTLTGSQYFYCTLTDAAGTQIEIVKVTARTSDTMTIVRGQDNTIAQSFIANDKVELRLVAANLNNFPKLNEDNTFTGSLTAPALSATTGAFSGRLSLNSGGTGVGSSALYASGDIVTFRTSTTGVVYLGSSGSNYLYYDGANYQMPNGSVVATGFSGSGASLTSLNASNISSGTVGTARLASGTANSSTYLRGDQTWATLSGGQYYGSATTKAIAYNANSISENVTVLANTNGLSAGPISISTGYTVTVETGANWVIV